MINSSEIAKIVGVSRSTVSRVINGYSNVPPETREKVEKAIREYGYVPNTAARNLAGKPSSTVGLFIIEYGVLSENIIHSSPFYSEFLVNAIDKLKRRGYQLLVSIINDPAEFETILAQYTNRSICGCIMMGDIVANPVLKRFQAANCPVFLINQRDKTPFSNIYLLNTENYQGAYNAVQLLVDAGHRRIAHITGSMEKTSIKERFEGYRDCLTDNNLTFCEDYVRYTHIHRAESGYQAMLELLEHAAEPPTAIFAANDLLAFGAMRALKEKGFRIPEDISVIGYDNAELSQYMSPPLTTVATSIEELTEMTVNNLLDVLEYEKKVPSYQKMEDFTIVERSSVAPCPQK